MVAQEAKANRVGSAELVRDNPDKLLRLIQEQADGPTLFAPAHHPVLPRDVNLARLEKIVRVAHEHHPHDFEALLGTPAVGPATIRSLALIAELIYAAPVSHRDPTEKRISTEAAKSADSKRRWADYSYAHGGKDGTPFPVDRKTYDQNIEVLTAAVRSARVGETEKTDALRRLARLTG
jgi:hypothetical protein